MKTREKKLLHKNTSLLVEIADVDTVTRKVKAYASAFGNIDSHGDVISKGAFLKSIKERGPQSTSNRRVAHLLQHYTDSPVGILTELAETEKGLMFVSALSKSTKGEDALIQYNEGILREHSVGGVIEKEEYVTKEKALELGYKSEFWNIKEFNLWEVSTVTFGANEQTPVITVGKSALENVSLLSKQLDSMQKLLRKGSISNEGCYLLEYQIEQIKTQVNSLTEIQEPRQTTQESNEPSDYKNPFELLKIL